MVAAAVGVTAVVAYSFLSFFGQHSFYFYFPPSSLLFYGTRTHLQAPTKEGGKRQEGRERDKEGHNTTLPLDGYLLLQKGREASCGPVINVPLSGGDVCVVSVVSVAMNKQRTHEHTHIITHIFCR